MVATAGVKRLTEMSRTLMRGRRQGTVRNGITVSDTHTDPHLTASYLISYVRGQMYCRHSSDHDEYAG